MGSRLQAPCTWLGLPNGPSTRNVGITVSFSDTIQVLPTRLMSPLFDESDDISSRSLPKKINNYLIALKLLKKLSY